VINLTIIVKSKDSILRERENWQAINRREVELFEKVLDFDIFPESNPVVKAMTKVDKLTQKIMDPIDQLSEDKYSNLTTATAFRIR
jgi:hypothetical protein